MGKFFSFILGFIVGILVTIASIYHVGKNVNQENQQESVPVDLPELSTPEEEPLPIHHFEVRKGNKYIELHTYMPKDSVALLFGKPHKIDTHINQYSNDFYEKWSYCDEWDIPRHVFNFENGKLMDVDSY